MIKKIHENRQSH